MTSQRINTRQKIQRCRVCGEWAIVTDGFDSLCYKHSYDKNNIKPWKFYNSPKWKKLRDTVLKRDKVCQDCGGEAQCVVHKVEVASGGETEEYNLKAICRHCNSKKYFQTKKQEQELCTLSP